MLIERRTWRAERRPPRVSRGLADTIGLRFLARHSPSRGEFRKARAVFRRGDAPACLCFAACASPRRKPGSSFLLRCARWIPACAGMTGKWRYWNLKQGMLHYYRDGDPPGSCRNSLPLSKGAARRKTLTYGVREPSKARGGRLSARHKRRSINIGPRFTSRSQKDFRSVSQLLAGTLSGPGRSPDAARVT